jgi:hypothetical protein
MTDRDGLVRCAGCLAVLAPDPLVSDTPGGRMFHADHCTEVSAMLGAPRDSEQLSGMARIRGLEERLGQLTSASAGTAAGLAERSDGLEDRLDGLTDRIGGLERLLDGQLKLAGERSDGLDNRLTEVEVECRRPGGTKERLERTELAISGLIEHGPPGHALPRSVEQSRPHKPGDCQNFPYGCRVCTPFHDITVHDHEHGHPAGHGGIQHEHEHRHPQDVADPLIRGMQTAGGPGGSASDGRNHWQIQLSTPAGDSEQYIRRVLAEMDFQVESVSFRGASFLTGGFASGTGSSNAVTSRNHWRIELSADKDWTDGHLRTAIGELPGLVVSSVAFQGAMITGAGGGAGR